MIDLIDSLVPLTVQQSTYAARHERAKVVDATQSSYEAIFAPSVQGISVVERLHAAHRACELAHADALTAHYARRLLEEGSALSKAAGLPASDARLQAILQFSATLTERPLDGDKAALEALTQVGLSTPAIVALAQLIAFVSYQIRLVAGLSAMAMAEPGGSDALATAQRLNAMDPRVTPKGFTSDVVGWRAWLPTVALQDASAEQIAALEAMSPTAKQSAYFLSLVHQSEILLQRSIAFNAIMFAPGGLPRAERELGATVESRINGCIYCASVHAQRFEQLAKRRDVIDQVFAAPLSAGTTARERAIVQFSAALTLSPHAMRAEQIRPLQAVGLSPLEILDLMHAVALFAWANRLMLNLGEPVAPATAS